MEDTLKSEEKNVSQLLWHFAQTLKQDHFTLYELIDTLQERSFGILLLLMALPNALMISAIPGVSSLFGAILTLVSLQMMQRRDKPWLPQRLGHKLFSKKGLESLLTISHPYLQPVERHLKSRWHLLTSTYFERLIGGICLLHSILITLPIPLGNFLPGIALVFLSLGILAKDGTYIAIGIILSLGIFMFFTLAFEGIIKGIQSFIG